MRKRIMHSSSLLTEEEATEKAQELLARVINILPTAHINVWNNLGWTYNVTNGYVSVYPSSNNLYYAGINDVLNHPGIPVMWDGDSYNEDPVKSILFSIDSI